MASDIVEVAFLLWGVVIFPLMCLIFRAAHCCADVDVPI